ncbi:unnamed protein product [Camellia sinensis]
MSLDLLKDIEVDAIVGPQKSSQANFVMELGDRAHFVQTALSNDTQVGAIAAIIEAFQCKEVVIIYEDTDYGNGVVPYLSNALKDIARISYRSIIPLSASDDFILSELSKMMTMETRAFVVHMTHSLGMRLFLTTKEIGIMSEGYAWIITDGCLGVKPRIPKSSELDSSIFRWKMKFLQDNPTVKQAEISSFGLWAYDTMWALAMAVEIIGFRKPITLEKNAMNLTNLFSFGISQTGPKLHKAMLETRFEGLSGEFYLVNGRLRPLPFQILNVVGKGEREVGIWTQSHGISREFNMNAANSSSTLKENFRAIIWPKESTHVPKDGFTEFAKVEIDSQSNSTTFSGYCIEIFDYVLKALPYNVPSEYVPLKKVDDENYYNDLVYQVNLQQVSGGVFMIVPITYEDNNSKWIFLKPFNMDLWLTSIAFFIFTGFAVWVLEHRINIAFRGPPSQHVVVFPKGSPLVTDISRAIINITEGRKILDTEQQWFGNTTCPERNSFTSNSLTLQSFVGLFSITGCVTALLLIVYIVKYIYGNIDLHKRMWDSSTTTWSRFCALCRHFDQRDLLSYPFSKKRDRIDQELELNDIGGSFHFSDAPSLSRNSNSNEMVSLVGEVYDAIEGVDPNSEDMVVVHI